VKIPAFIELCALHAATWNSSRQAAPVEPGSAQDTHPDSEDRRGYFPHYNTWKNKKDDLPLGVYRWKGCSGYVAKFGTRYLGTFSTISEAAEAYWQARREEEATPAAILGVSLP